MYARTLITGMIKPKLSWHIYIYISVSSTYYFFRFLLISSSSIFLSFLYAKSRKKSANDDVNGLFSMTNQYLNAWCNFNTSQFENDMCNYSNKKIIFYSLIRHKSLWKLFLNISIHDLSQQVIIFRRLSKKKE